MVETKQCLFLVYHDALDAFLQSAIVGCAQELGNALVREHPVIFGGEFGWHILLFVCWVFRWFFTELLFVKREMTHTENSPKVK